MVHSKFFAVCILLLFVLASSSYARKPVKLSDAQMEKIEGAMIVIPVVYPHNAMNRVLDPIAQMPQDQREAVLAGIAGAGATVASPLTGGLYWGGVALDMKNAGDRYYADNPQDQKCIRALHAVNSAIRGDVNVNETELRNSAKLLGTDQCAGPIDKYNNAMIGSAIPALRENADVLVGGAAGKTAGSMIKGSNVIKKAGEILVGDIGKSAANSHVAGDPSLIKGTADRMVVEYTDPMKIPLIAAGLLIPSKLEPLFEIADWGYGKIASARAEENRTPERPSGGSSSWIVDAPVYSAGGQAYSIAYNADGGGMCVPITTKAHSKKKKSSGGSDLPSGGSSPAPSPGSTASPIKSPTPNPGPTLSDARSAQDKISKGATVNDLTDRERRAISNM